MLIIADKRIPEKAKVTLSKYGNLLLLKTDNIVYDTISGHPDIFFCQMDEKLIVASNLPESFKEKLNKHSLTFIEGGKPVGVDYPASAVYNAVVTKKYLIHNLKITDKAVLDASENLIKINVNQAYTRCNLLPLSDDKFITSDRGIEKSLRNEGLEVLYVLPKGIILPGFKHGFFGGVCGVYQNMIFIIGSLAKYPDGDKVKSFLTKMNYEIIELYDGHLFDGGSLIFV